MKKVLMALLFFLSASAHADPVWMVSGFPYQGPSALEACRAVAGKNTGAFDAATYVAAAAAAFITPLSASAFRCGTHEWSGHTVSGEPYTNYGGSENLGTVVLVGGSCAAPTSVDPTTGMCQGPQCTPGRIFETTIAQGTVSGKAGVSTDMRYPTNVGGCSVSVEALLSCDSTPPSSGTARPVYCKYRLKEGAASASGAAESPTGQPPANTPTTPTTSNSAAPPGGCPKGTMNVGTDSAGTPMCAGGGTAPKPPAETTSTTPPVTTANPDGSTTTTKTESRVNSDGSTTTKTTETKTNPDGSTTTKVTEATGNDASGATGEKDKPMDDFCAKHPELNACKNSSVSGSCDSTACDGDAIMCAATKAAREINCREKLLQDGIEGSTQHALGQAAAAGNDPMKATLPTAANGQSVVMPTSLDSSGWLGAGSCFPDKQFTVQGRVITISFSAACTPLLAFRYALMVVALIFSFRMLSGVIFRE